MGDMNSNFSTARLVVTTGLVLLVGYAWALVGPTQIGGPASYVVTEGNSMEPLLEQGDLVVVKERENYRKGDVIAYNSRSIGRVVLHRIVDIEGDAYILKGDNNSWTDNETPTKDQIIGRKWATLSGGGRFIGWLREPRNASMALGAVGLLIFASLARPMRRNRKLGARRATREPSGAWLRFGSGESSLDAFVQRHGARVLAIAGVLFVVLTLAAVLAMRQPAGQAFTRTIPYEHRGTFEYSAQVEPNAVYPSGTVRSGQPIFTKLVDQLELSFTYELKTVASLDATGTGALWVLVSDDAGWVDNFPLDPDASFEGKQATVSGTLDLRDVRRKIEEVQRLTGVYQDFYNVEVAARIDIAAAVQAENTELSDRFTARLPMSLDPLRLKLISPNSRPEEIPKLLAPTEEGSIEAARFEEGQRSFVLVSSLLFGALLCLGAIALMVLKHRSVGTVPVSDAARYEKWIVPVRTISSEHAIKVELASLEALADLARSTDKMIFRVEVGDRYYVEAEGVLYSYGGTRS